MESVCVCDEKSASDKYRSGVLQSEVYDHKSLVKTLSSCIVSLPRVFVLSTKKYNKNFYDQISFIIIFICSYV